MKNIKEIVSTNLVNLRKQKNLTQIELGEIVNYSDKAISRWEKGESLPDVGTLQTLCDALDVPITYIFEEHIEGEKSFLEKNQSANKIVCTALSVSIVWLVAVVFFLYLKIYNHYSYWQTFVWAVVASSIVLKYFNYIWGKKVYSIYIDSLFIWSAITALYCHFISYNLWLIFFIGAPVQIVIILNYFIKTLKKLPQKKQK